MKFGYFDDQNKEYVITTPQTPLPWINQRGFLQSGLQHGGRL